MEQSGQNAQITLAPDLLCLRPGHGNGGELRIVGIGQRGLEFISEGDYLALAAILAGQHCPSTRTCDNLIVVPAGEQSFERAELDQRIDALDRNAVKRRCFRGSWPA